jgi:hypothetical protein
MRYSTFGLRHSYAAFLLATLAVAGCSDVLPSPSTPSPVADQLTLSASPAFVTANGSTTTIQARMMGLEKSERNRPEGLQPDPERDARVRGSHYSQTIT